MSQQAIAQQRNRLRITGAFLDSLATLKLVAFLEEQFGIEIQAHEAGVDHLNTIQDIASLVRSKKAGG